MYDRDGRERGESLQGDMYIRDLRNTKGHVSPCTNGAWHPLDRLVSSLGWHMWRRQVLPGLRQPPHRQGVAPPGEVSKRECCVWRAAHMVQADSGRTIPSPAQTGPGPSGKVNMWSNKPVLL